MLWKLFLAFTIIPVSEIYILIAIGGQIGILPSIGLVILTGIVGASLARSQGLQRPWDEFEILFSRERFREKSCSTLY